MSVEQGPDPGLARGDDLPPQRVRPPAEAAQHVLGQVSGMVADLPEVLAPASVHAAATARTKTSGYRRPRGFRGSGTRASTASRPGTFPAPFSIMLVTAVIAGMRHWHRRPFVPV